MKERNYTLYMHINLKNNKKYIGITSNTPNKRWWNGKGYKSNKYFYRSIQKYGWDNFEHEIVLCNLTKEEAEMFEVELIKFYKTQNRELGYNIDGGGSLNKKISEETREKLKISHLGQKSWSAGKKFTQEHRMNISKAKRGKSNGPIKEETKLKISKAHKGRKKSKSTIDKMLKTRQERYGGEDSKLYGNELGKEIAKKISNSLKGRFCGKDSPHYGNKMSEETKQKLRRRFRKVICIETNKVYENAKSAAMEMNINHSYICRCCNDGNKCKGYHFKYIDKQ